MSPAKSQEIVTLLSIASLLNKSGDQDEQADKPFHNFSKIIQSFKNKRIQNGKINEHKYKYYMENSTALSLFQKAYKLTGTSKVEGVIEFCNNLVEQKLKFLVFAHHIRVLNQLQQNFENKKVKFVRIDGQISSKARFECVGNASID